MRFCAFLCATMMATASAFAPTSKIQVPALTTTESTTSLNQAIDYNPNLGGPMSDDPVDRTLMSMFPTDIPMRKMQGGGTVRTWDIPPEAERLSYYIRTNGRPLKALVELWVGPIRRIHSVDIECEDGDQTPFRAMLKFKPGTKTLKISTTGSHEFPIEFGAEVPNAQRMEETWAATQKVFDTSPKTTVQGGSTEGGGGSVRYFNIPDDVETTQMVLWSRDIGKRTVKAQIEVLQGPNSVRQLYTLHCGGSTQPYHCVIPTPGPGWTIRIIATNYMEFPFSAVVTPYELTGEVDQFGHGPAPLYMN
ncbi:unnamed protein product [Pseudo-nitzschia multistriata]|uniref:Uncharacterized protein n=1 Tax=Pseudo-nitzschia multistriata TaxID=183589 RepID=A0A448ZBA6_9STRA|nr:unnamed protein product [Pseudo-nitzschia multistriata]